MALAANLQEVRRRRLASPLALIIGVGLLYVAREVLIPLALALLLSFLLAPLVRRLERVGLPRVLATVLVVLLVAALLIGMVTMLIAQLVDLGRNLPEYQANVAQKLEHVGDNGLVSDVTQMLEGLQTRAAVPRNTVPVQVVDDEPHRFERVTTLIGPIIAPIAMTGLVVVFVVFMLIQWKDLQERLLRLSGQGHLSVTTRALEDAAARVSRYLQMQLLINATTGTFIGLGVWAIGVPNAFLWGLLAGVLRFIPYIGPWVGALLPISFSLATSNGFTQPLWVAGIVIAMELTANNVLEPWLYGKRTGVSPVGILVMAVFWAWLWGGVGLVLATPLTVCLVVAGRYLPQLEFLHVLLSDQQALPHSARLYQRLLSLEPEEASDLVETMREKRGATALFDDILIPSLQLAERERHGDELADERATVVYDAFRSFVIESQGEHAVEETEPARVLCVAADDLADQLSAIMVAQILRRSDLPADVMEEGFTASKLIERVAVDKPKVVLVSALPPAATIQARDRCRKLRQLFPKLPIVVGYWVGSEDPLDDKALRRLRDAGASDIVFSLGEAAERCRSLVGVDSRPRLVDTLPPDEREEENRRQMQANAEARRKAAEHRAAEARRKAAEQGASSESTSAKDSGEEDLGDAPAATRRGSPPVSAADDGVATEGPRSDAELKPPISG